MLTWIIQIFLLSLIFIFLLHHLFCYMKDTLTIPKVKDLVSYSSKKYDNIYSILSNQNKIPSNEISSYTEIDLLPNNADSLMKDELKNFLKKNLNKGEEYTDASSDLYSENYTYL